MLLNIDDLMFDNDSFFWLLFQLLSCDAAAVVVAIEVTGCY